MNDESGIFVVLRRSNIYATSNKFQCRSEFKSCKNIEMHEKLLESLKIFRHRVGEQSLSGRLPCAQIGQ